MSFPISYPVVSGPGRLTEICTFRKSAISEEELRTLQFNSIYATIGDSVAKFPISVKGIIGVQTADRRVAAMIADWTSAAEKDVFEPGEQYQSVKPHFGKIIDAANPTFACHHIILPTGANATPDAAVYVVSHATVQQADQPTAAAAYTEFLAGAPADVDFLVVAASREDANVLVTLSGHKDAAAAAAFQQLAGYKKLQAAVAAVATATSSYDVEYQSSSVY